MCETDTNHCSDVIFPVENIDTKSVHSAPEPCIALCLSGGGFRAMLFHAGALWRLNELGYLSRLARISSVSGGSIAAAVLGLHWGNLHFDEDGVAAGFHHEVITPLRSFASRTIDIAAMAGGILLPGSIADHAIKAYHENLFGTTTLQNLPDYPRFVINATNMQSGALWRFMKPYMRDYRVGEVKNPTIPLSIAVAASAAFPPVLSPVMLHLNEADFTPHSGLDLQKPPFTTDVVLTDGGIYDNLALETAWKRYQTVFVSDAGTKVDYQAEPATDWIRHTARALTLINSQVINLRKRQVVAAFVNKQREGAYWGIRTDITHYNLPDALECPIKRTMELAHTPTRLKRMEDDLQERLINWGYAVCDAAIRRHVLTDIPAPKFPYALGV